MQMVVEWQGGRIGGGASVFHFEDPVAENESESVSDLLREFFLDLPSLVSNDITWNFPSEARILNPTTGDLIRIEPLSAQAPVSGSSTAAYANGSGAMVRLNTSAIAGNRRLLGRLFLVPLSSAVFATNGDVGSTARGTIDAAYEAFRAAVQVYCPHVVWSRTYGTVAPVTLGATQARPATLRTRNDR